MRTSIIFLLSLILGTTVFNQNCPTFQRIIPPFNTFGFKSIWCGTGPTVNTLFIHDPQGEAYRSMDGGVYWTRIGCGNPLSQMNDCGCVTNECYNSISFEADPVNPNQCQNKYGIAVCDNGLLKETLDFGDTWKYFDVALYFEMPNINIVKCHYTNGHFEMIGNSGFYAYAKKDCVFPYASGYMMFFGQNQDLLGLSKVGWPAAVCGERGLLGRNGWSVPVIIATGTTENLNAVVQTEDYRTIVAVGMNGVIIVSDGQTSKPYQDPRIIKTDFYGVAQSKIDNIFYAVGTNGTIFRFSVHGLNLIPLSFCNSFTTETLRDIDINENAIYIVGDNSTILKGQ